MSAYGSREAKQTCMACSGTVTAEETDSVEADRPEGVHNILRLRWLLARAMMG